LPIKSWSFTHLGHPVRAEIWWRFTGWNRKLLYIDHKRVVGKRGRFTMGRPMIAEVDGPDGTKQTIEVRFRPSWNPFDMGCELRIGDGQPMPVPSNRVYKRWLHQSDSGEEPENPVVQKLGCLLIFAFLLIMCVLYAPLMIVGGITRDWKERRLKHRLRRCDRCLSWQQLEQRMQSLQSPSTLILQMANLTPTRVWWTPDNVLLKSPLPLPDEMVVMSPGRSDHPFFEWCQAKYLDEERGTAMHLDISPSDAKNVGLFEKGNDPKRLHARYPMLNVIVTGYTHGKRQQAASRFRDILGDDIHAAMPGLIAGVTDDDATIRRLCRESIRFAGEIAAGAVPTLERELYLAASDETYSIAETLAALGPAGREVLQEAESCGDPKIHRSAKSALAMRRILH
jgi:hypothetical protein